MSERDDMLRDLHKELAETTRETVALREHQQVLREQILKLQAGGDF
jgi:hypothetical protein